MKKNRLIALMLALVFLLSLCACGGSQDSTTASAASASEETPAAEAPVEEPPEEITPIESAEEASVAEVPEKVEISYPIEGDYSFTMNAVMRNVTAQVFGDGDYSITPVYEELSQATGITIEFIMLAESSANEKLSVNIASGDLPDVYNSTLGNTYDTSLLTAYEDGILMDMAPLVAENAPDYLAMLDSNPQQKKAIYNADGSLTQFASYAVPFVSKGMLIRNDWLQDLNLDMPKTLDDLTNVLQAFKNEKGATLPLLVTGEIESGLSRFFNSNFTGFRDVGFQQTGPDSGEIVAVYASEPYIEYLLYLRSLFEKGLLTTDFLTTGREYGNYESSFYSGISGVWQEGGTILNETSKALASDPAYDPQPFALELDDGHVSEATNSSTQGKNYITTACEDPEILMQFFNYCYTDAGQRLVEFGVEGISYEMQDGKPVYTDLVTNNPEGWAIFIANAYYTGINWLPTQQTQDYVESSYTAEALEAIDLWTTTSGDRAMLIPTGCTLTAEETLEKNELAGDILTLFTENAPSLVTGEITEEDYRGLIEDAYDMGLDRMTEIYQGALDRFLAA